MKSHFRIAGVFVGLVLSVAAVACGSASTEESVGSGAQAQKTPPVSGNPAHPTPRPPAGPPPAVCVSHPGCSMVPFSSPATFPVPTVRKSKNGEPIPGCGDATDFTAYLTSIGCIPVGSYMEANEGPPGPWYVPIGFCPKTPVIDDGVKWETMPCDECTGTPENGDWVVVAYTNADVHTCTGGSPGTGCTEGGCLPAGGVNY